ncbi:MAG: pyridoxamine 5'-phosphate oxidase family protein [Alistipes sp.]|uniref:pyridoxamine 5'-phosphate oxidase family protein n=1 Tax=Alistipes sp. TaxID=1872444 RepID=UPI001B4E74EC|nr:pyridoxamine 5'-phosphate oxidase family protein [Alistipes sp.]
MSNTLIDKRFAKFIAKHHVLTVATVGESGVPYVANCFYAYDPKRNIFVFTSDTTTRHGSEMARDGRVALSIVLETRVVGRVEGLQVEGVAEAGDSEAKSVYIKRFPYAAVAPLTLWMVRPTMLKLTDNTLGFGTKLIWRSEE